MSRWPKGGPSPNPGGRPKTARYAAAAREVLAAGGKKPPEAWGRESGWTNAQAAAWQDFRCWNDSADAQAASRVLDRAEGRPATTLELSGGLDLKALPEGVTPDAARAIQEDPDGFLVAEVTNLIYRAPDIMGRVLASVGARDTLRALMVEAEAKATGLVSPALPSGTEENGNDR